MDRITRHPMTPGTQVESFACAINTIAHEWAHTIPDPSDAGVWLYQDDDHEGSDEALVSYAIGAIAQCVYLDMQGYRVEEQFDECMRRVGTTTFNSTTCAAGWAETTFGRR
ncbi:MAG: hypothetical protein U0271_43950 [Polyangiaceae bacterium]